MNTVIFGERVKELRLKNNITQGELAEAMGMTATGVSYCESWKAMPNTSTLLKLSDYFNVPIAYLIGEDSNTNKEQLLFRKIDKVDENKKELLMNILNNTIESFINDGKK